MKHISTIIISAFIILNSFAQPNIDSIMTKVQFGQSYITFELSKNDNSDSSYFAIIPPIFETYIDSVMIKEVPYGDVEVVYVTTSTVYEKTPSAYSWSISQLSDEIKQQCIDKASFPNKPNIVLRKVENNAEYITEDIEVIMTFKGQLDSVYYEYLQIEKQRKITDGAVKLLSHKNEVLHPNQTVIALPNNNWSDFKDIICPVPIAPKITKIQIALNNKGYPCPIDGVLNSETKAALIKLGKDINIPICCRMGCNYLLWEALELPGY